MEKRTSSKIELINNEDTFWLNEINLGEEDDFEPGVEIGIKRGDPALDESQATQNMFLNLSDFDELVDELVAYRDSIRKKYPSE